MVRMNDPYPKRKCPARRLSKFLGSDTTNRILAWVGTFAVSLTARELFRWLINVMRHRLRVLHCAGCCPQLLIAHCSGVRWRLDS